MPVGICVAWRLLLLTLDASGHLCRLLRLLLAASGLLCCLLAALRLPRDASGHLCCLLAALVFRCQWAFVLLPAALAS
eukprot:6491611-Amphidinium_carterae.1